MTKRFDVISLDFQRRAEAGHGLLVPLEVRKRNAAAEQRDAAGDRLE